MSHHQKKVRDLMIPISEYATVALSASIQEAVRLLETILDESCCSSYRSVLVMDENGNALGILTLRDLIKAIAPQVVDPNLLPNSITWIIEDTTPNGYLADIFSAERGKSQAQKTVREVMGKMNLITVEAETPLIKAVHIMIQKNIGTLPVIDQGKLVGIIRINEVFREIAKVIN